MDGDTTLLRRSEALRRVAEALNETLDAEAAIAALLPELEGLLGLRTAWAFRYRAEHGKFFKIAATGLPPALAADGQQVLNEGSCECQRRFLAGHLHQAVNMVTCSRLRDAQGDRGGLVQHASVPLRNRERILGILNVAAPGDTHFDRESLALLSAVGNQFTVALDRAESHAASEHRAQQLAALADVGRLLSAEGDPEVILSLAVNLAVSRLDIHRAAILRQSHAVAFAALDGAVPAGSGTGPTVFAGSRASLRTPISEDEVFVSETPAADRIESPDDAVFDAFAAHLTALLSAARHQQELRQAAVLSERQRIAADLHDAVSQRLFSAILNLHAARIGVERNTAAGSAEQLEIAEGQVRLAQSELRTLARTLLLSAPADLPSAVSDLVRAFSVGTGPKIEQTIAPRLPDLSQEAAQALLRVAQEALHNALRHADASVIRVFLGRRGAHVVLTVRDDGCGFAVSAPAGAGVGSMGARAAAVGADLRIRSRKGRGTSVQMRIPVQPQTEEGTT